MHRSGIRPARAAATLCAGFFLAAAVRGGRGPALLERAAMASAAFAAPDAAAAALRERYRDLIEEETGAPTPEDPSEPPAPQQLPAPHAQAAPSSSAAPPAQEEIAPPAIPDEYRGTVREEDFSGYEGGPYYRSGRAWLRNYTDWTSDDLDEILQTPSPIADDGGGPVVLIYHTHATESFTPYDAGIYDMRSNWRSTDTALNMVAVGDVMAAALEARGVGVLHDTELHDYPSYDGSYASSYDSVSDYLARYPSIRVVLDLHRDAIERAEGLIVKPTAVIGGEKYAQLMVISNCDDGSGLIPNWRENLRFAVAFTDAVEARAPGLTRPILFSHRKYNQQLSSGALLLEFGSHANTLAEAKRTARVAGDALADFLLRKEAAS